MGTPASKLLGNWAQGTFRAQTGNVTNAASMAKQYIEPSPPGPKFNPSVQRQQPTSPPNTLFNAQRSPFRPADVGVSAAKVSGYSAQSQPKP
jgi:hypothetical protein